ncbi:MAG: helix-turn-helix domain-containing protein [Chloroflexota bacterium]|nr:helix-turn-helix domain-containing protein [Chloroflexota bacterium]
MSDEWLSLKGASELLGVHPSTVRLWSNKGLLPVHLTQGGHRRYLRHEVELWEANRQQVEPGEMMQMVIRNVRLQIAEGKLEAEAWYQKLDADARIQYRESARSLFHGLMAFISDGENAAMESHAIGYEYASRARRYGLSYVDAARAFLFFRYALLESVMNVYRKANVSSQEMLQKIQIFTDKILISLLETYQKLESSK